MVRKSACKPLKLCTQTLLLIRYETAAAVTWLVRSVKSNLLMSLIRCLGRSERLECEVVDVYVYFISKNCTGERREYISANSDTRALSVPADQTIEG